MDLKKYQDMYLNAPSFVKNLRLAKVVGSRLSDYVEDKKKIKLDPSIDSAHLISSQIKDTDTHALILDVDFPVEVWESSSGNSHVFIDVKLTKEQLNLVMKTLSEVGVVQKFWADEAVRRKSGAYLRMPWVRKDHDDRSIKEWRKHIEDKENYPEDAISTLSEDDLSPF